MKKNMYFFKKKGCLLRFYPFLCILKGVIYLERA